MNKTQIIPQSILRRVEEIKKLNAENPNCIGVMSIRSRRTGNRWVRELLETEDAEIIDTKFIEEKTGNNETQ